MQANREAILLNTCYLYFLRISTVFAEVRWTIKNVPFSQYLIVSSFYNEKIYKYSKKSTIVISAVHYKAL